MARCIFENLSHEQAIVLARWFEGSGEQQAEGWFEETDVPSIWTNVGRKGGYRETLPNGDVVVHCRTVR
jgi:hypothetical protein